MDFDRRRFLQLSAAGILSPTVSLGAIGAETTAYYGQFAIMQGATDETTTEIVVVHQQGLKYDFLAAIGKKGRRPSRVRTASYAGSGWVVTKAYFTNLTPETDYDFYVIYDGRTIDQRIFRTLNLTKKNARIAVASCMQDFLHHADIWEDLWAQKPDMIFFVGDTVYADFDGWSWVPADAPRLWRRHVETRNRLAGYRQQRLIPILAVWDDHDFGFNNSNREFQFKAQAKQIFEIFFAQDSDQCSALITGPGVSRRLSAFGQEFYFLDGRTYRSPEANDSEAMFGADLTNWIYRGLDTAQRPSWFISGSQFFGGPRGKEAFESSFPEQFRAFTDRLKDSRGPYGFISGDIHYSEVMEIEREFLGYQALELTSSSMHSFSIPGNHNRHPNPRRVAASSYHNYLLLDIQAGREDLRVTTTCRRAGRSLFRTDHQVRA